MLIFFPFSLSTTISFSFFSSLGWCLSNNASIFCFFLFTQYSLHLVIIVWKLHNFCSEIPVHLCFNWKFAQMWQLETWFVYFYTPEWSDGQLVSCSLSIGHFLCQISFAYWRNQVKAVLVINLYLQVCSSLSLKLSILFSACNIIFQHKGYKSKYEFWLYFSTKGMNQGLKLLYLLVLKWPPSC